VNGDDAVGLVQQAVAAGLGQAFDDRDGGFRVVEELLGDSFGDDDRVVAVPWELPCTHARRFLEIEATFVDLVIRGLTLVVENPDKGVLLHRYIDWAQVMSDLGMSMTFRPALEARIE
jgi:hypothetical protein